MYEKLTLTVQQAYERLQQAGIPLGYVKLREGLVQGAFPFGCAIKAPSGQMMFAIYKVDLEKFIVDKGGRCDAENS